MELQEEKEQKQFKQDQQAQFSQNQSKAIMLSSQQKSEVVRKTQIRKRKKAKVFQFAKIYQQIYYHDDEPTYIYFLLKIYKSYDQDGYLKFRNYGYTDAKIAKIEYVQHDKKYQTVDISLDFCSQGVDNFKKLIKIFQSKQNMQYYLLSQALEQYQNHLNVLFSKIESIFSDKSKFSESVQDRVDQAYPYFEQKVKEWAHEQLENELYEIELCLVKFKQQRPTLKKKIYSRNLMLFLGSDLQGIYSKLIDLNLKDDLQNLLNGGEINGELQLEKTIKILKWIVQQQSDELTFQDEILTIDGISIPTQKTIKYYSYDYKKNQVVQYHQLHFFYVTTYNFDPNWIQYLIQTRQNLQQLPKQIQYEQSPNIIENQIQTNLEFICKQEYFLEKFNYIKKQ